MRSNWKANARRASSSKPPSSGASTKRATALDDIAATRDSCTRAAADPRRAGAGACRVRRGSPSVTIARRLSERTTAGARHVERYAMPAGSAAPAPLSLPAQDRGRQGAAAQGPQAARGHRSDRLHRLRGLHRVLPGRLHRDRPGSGAPRLHEAGRGRPPALHRLPALRPLLPLGDDRHVGLRGRARARALEDGAHASSTTTTPSTMHEAAEARAQG